LAVVEEEVDPSNSDSMITRTRHKFSGHPTLGIKGNGVLGTGYRRWLEAKELETEQFNFNGSVMRRSTNLYEQQSGVDWIAGATSTTLEQPENNPRLTKVTSQLLDGGNKTSTVDYTYDEFNNVLTEELKGFDGQVIRKVERTYLRNLNGIDYAGLNRQVAPPSNPNEFDTHLKSLILSESIKNKFNSIESTSTYEYDNYSDDGSHAALDPRSLPANLHDPIYQSTSRVQRGNVTSITRGAGTPEASTIYSQYDVLGNVVAIVGPLANQKTETDYSLDSKFTFPTQTRQFVSGGVSGNRVLTSNRTYDFDTGLVITSTGFNNDTTTFQYNDQLDRLTREIRPVGFGETTYSYSAAGIYPNTVTVQSTLDTTQDLTSISKFDGFLRTIEQRRTDPEGAVVSTTEYDASGRVAKVTNPFREFQSLPTNGYTTTSYDALDRILTVSTFAEDGTFTGTVTTEYETNLVTVTDQAGKKRKSETDAAGRLINVFEPDEQNNLNIVTSYIYDARSNLREVNQGEQTRLFNYDSLSRLLSATSPESGDNNGNGATFYTYDKASNLIERRDPRNLITSYTYDSLNRLATKSYSDGTPSVSYFYDAAPSSLPTGATAPSGFSYQNTLGRATAIASPTTGNNTPTGLFHSYDIGGRITNSSQLLDGQHYTTTSQYNAASLPIGHTYPSGRTISHTFNIAGQITGVDSNNETISFDNLYTPAGAIRSQQLGNGLYHLMTYNSRLQPTTIGLGFTSFSSDLWKLDYNYSQYDFNSLNSAATTTPTLSNNQAQNNGNIGSIRLTPGNGTTPIDQFFTYDELNRLKLAKEFVSAPSPLLSNLIPTSGSQATTVDITVLGENLSQAQTLVFTPSDGITISNFQVLSSSLITARITISDVASVGDRSVKVITLQGETNEALFTVLENRPCNVPTMLVSIEGDGEGDGSGVVFSNRVNNVVLANYFASSTFSIDLTNPNLNPNITLFPRWDMSVQYNPGISGRVQLAVKLDNQLAFTKELNIVVDSVGNFISNGTLVGNPSLGGTFVLQGGGGSDEIVALADKIGSQITITYEWTFSFTPTTTGFVPIARVTGSPITGCFTSSPVINNNSQLSEPFALASSMVAWSQQYVYDRYGNRRAVIGNNAQSFNINSAKNRLPDFDFSYDEAGNLTKDDLGNSYVYDAENRLTQVFNGDNSLVAEYFYDGNGWRVKKIANGVTTRFIYDQSGRLLAEYIGEPVPSLDAPTKEHIYGASGMLATVEADKINYHTPDHLGSPRILTDGFGQVISRRDFLPFGEQLDASLGNRASVQGYIPSADFIKQKFTGYFKDDESGLDFAQARHFNGALGRFMQPDEFTGGPEEFYDFVVKAADNPTFYAILTDPQSLNKYQYAYNNPLLYVDPNGHQGVREFFDSVATTFVRDVGIEKGVTYLRGKSLPEVTNRAGAAVGHGLAIAVGTAELVSGTIIGTGGAAGGIITSPTGVGAVAGGATAVAGASIATTGAYTIVNTLGNILSSSSTGSPSSPSTSGSTAVSNAASKLPDFSGQKLNSIEKQLANAGFSEKAKVPGSTSPYRTFTHVDGSKVSIDTANKQVKVNGPKQFDSTGTKKYAPRYGPHNQPYDDTP